MLLALTACNGSPSDSILPADTFPQSPLVTPEVQVVSIDSFPADVFVQHPDLVCGPLDIEPLALPLEGWKGNIPLRYDGALHGDALLDTMPRIERDVSINPMQYTHLEVTVAVEDGDRLLVWWDRPETATKPPHTRALILADNQPHTYLVPLEYGEDMPWRRPIDHLGIAPSNGVSSFALHSLRFVAIPPAHPLRLTLDRTTMPTSRFTRLDLALPALPDGATLSLGLGAPGNAVRFHIAQLLAGHQTVLLDRTISGARWEFASVDIPPTLSPSVVTLRQPSGYWGAPIIDIPRQEAEVIPIVLISNDTMRADHLGCYGYERDTSPVFDAFAQEAVLFEEAFTPESYTLTAHMSMLTGLYPKNHGLTENLNLREEALILPEALRNRGYVTGGFAGMEWWFTAWRGFAQGMHMHDVPDVYRSVFDTYALARHWLNHLPNDRFFLFLHNYDLHSKLDYGLPYDSNDDRFRQFSAAIADPPAFPAIEQRENSATLYLAEFNADDASLSAAQNEYMRALYDDCIRKVDFAAGEVFQLLKDRGLYDRALIIVTSDHGEAFGEQGRYLHGDVYEHNIHVPLLIKFPDQQYGGTRVKGMVHLMDIYPTVLDVLGMEAPEGLDGQSLMPLIQGQTTDHKLLYATRGAWRAVRTEADKLIRELVRNETEYYDLAQDPAEQANRAGEKPERTTQLRGLLDEFFAPSPGGWQIALYTGAETWHLKFSVASTAKLESVRLARSNAVERIDFVSASQWVEAAIELTPQVGQDVLIVKPVQGHEEVRLNLSSETPFSVRLGNETLDAITELDEILSPEDPRLQAPPPLMDSPVLPQVAIWYEVPEVTGTAAQELSQEDIEALKALGYLEE
jgi:arylsulfatase A-like enzyme